MPDVHLTAEYLTDGYKAFWMQLLTHSRLRILEVRKEEARWMTASTILCMVAQTPSTAPVPMTNGKYNDI